ncbi:MAG: VanZ family protein [Promethearchaeota archaeon]|nr:MAG: VanZ family protein [Candidatus Lokiarchaeota archaeon]
MEEAEREWILMDYLKIIPAITVAVIIFYFSSIPNPVPPTAKPSIEIDINTLLHIAEFGLFSFLIAFGFKQKTKNTYLTGFGVFYAIVDEIHQYFVPNRYFDILDIIADSIGVILGFLGFMLFEVLYRKFRQE